MIDGNCDLDRCNLETLMDHDFQTRLQVDSLMEEIQAGQTFGPGMNMNSKEMFETQVRSTLNPRPEPQSLSVEHLQSAARQKTRVSRLSANGNLSDTRLNPTNSSLTPRPTKTTP